MGDYTTRTSNAELADDSFFSHKWIWPKDTTIRESDLPKPTMTSTVEELEAAMEQPDPPSGEIRTKTGGRQKGTPNRMTRIDIGKAARIFSLQALGTLVDIMKDERQPGAVRVSAANSVLDRAHGKAKQITEIGGFDGGDIQTKLTIEFVGAPGQGSVTAAVPQAIPMEQDDGRIVDVPIRVVSEPQPATSAAKRPWEA